MSEKEFVRISILIPKEDKKELQEICDKFDTDLSKLIRQVLKIYVVNRKK